MNVKTGREGGQNEGGRESDEVREEGRDEESAEEVIDVGEDRVLRRRSREWEALHCHTVRYKLLGELWLAAQISTFRNVRRIFKGKVSDTLVGCVLETLC